MAAGAPGCAARRSGVVPRAKLRPEPRTDLTAQQLDLTRRGVDGPEDDRVEAVLDEDRDRLHPPVARSRERLAREITDRELGPPRRALISDHALEVEDPPYRGRVPALPIGCGIDLLVACTQLLAREDAERRPPAVGLAAHEAKHARLECSDPDPDLVGRQWTRPRILEVVVAAAE